MFFISSVKCTLIFFSFLNIVSLPFSLSGPLERCLLNLLNLSSTYLTFFFFYCAYLYFFILVFKPLLVSSSVPPWILMIHLFSKFNKYVYYFLILKLWFFFLKLSSRFLYVYIWFFHASGSHLTWDQFQLNFQLNSQGMNPYLRLQMLWSDISFSYCTLRQE